MKRYRVSVTITGFLEADDAQDAQMKMLEVIDKADYNNPKVYGQSWDIREDKELWKPTE